MPKKHVISYEVPTAVNELNLVLVSIIVYGGLYRPATTEPRGFISPGEDLVMYQL